MAITNDNIANKQLFLLCSCVFVEFRRFLPVVGENRTQLQDTTAEAQRLQRIIDQYDRDRVELESKLFHARRLVDHESKGKKAAEARAEAAVSEQRNCWCIYALLKSQTTKSNSHFQRLLHFRLSGTKTRTSYGIIERWP